jgi:hypothetical protein
MAAVPLESASTIGPATAVPQWLSLYSVNSTLPVGSGAVTGPETVALSPNFVPTVPSVGLCTVVTVVVGLLPKSLPLELTFSGFRVIEYEQLLPVPG